MTEVASEGLPAPAARKRRTTVSQLESRLEQQLSEIQADIAQCATKEDLEDVKRHVDRRADEILEAIGCRAADSSSK